MSDCDVGQRDGGEQQRHADAVVEPALDVEPLADALRHARLGDDRLPERRVGRRQHDRRAPAPRRAVSWPNRTAAAAAPSRDRQRQADPEQSHRDADRAAEVAQVDRARRRRTAPASASPRPAGARPSPPWRRSMPSRALRPTSSPKATNTIAGVIGVPSSRRETAATPSSASDTRTSVHSIRDIMAVGAALRDNSTARSPCAQRGGRRGVRIQAAVRPTAVRNETHAPLSA